ncbi:MAG: 23S rRNA (uracil(1939)-C(5))-methyltransferase RlmD [Candidatus Cloacimonadaceae bacterium]|jgi:23S rRNA (uracil1939-C5)-methyltransferase|nr:23S rRNA (uracil(1939)-C(5))-methyltransferase RlmD [Candidatus Cloacimonadaceae bacterium]
MILEKLKIEKIAMGGMGIGFYMGKAIFVANTAIGDLVDAEIYINKKDHAFAKALQFSERGEGVIDAPCEAFKAEEPCGGCDWLMLDYPTQLRYKKMLLQELFKEHLTVFNGIEQSELKKHYRNKVFMPVAKDGYGIYARYSHSIVRHEQCQNHPPVFDEIAKQVMELCNKANVEAYDEVNHSGCLRHIGIRCNGDLSEILLILVCRTARLPFSQTIVRGICAKFPQIIGIIQNINREKTNVILGAEEKTLFGRNYLSDTLANISYEINYRSFWQINLGTTQKILCAMRAKMKPHFKVIDAYCGIGSLGLSLATEISELIGIDEVPEAVSDARRNAENNGFDNANFICGKFEQQFGILLSSFNADCIILDPPRSGVQESALWSIREAQIPLVLYLSCSPMSLARDLKILMHDNSYKLCSLSGFDMFPNTWHIETLAVLERT